MARAAVPKDKTDVIQILALATYMTNYVRYFAKIAASIINLLKDKFEKITWTRDCLENFETVKKALTEATVVRNIYFLK